MILDKAAAFANRDRTAMHTQSNTTTHDEENGREVEVVRVGLNASVADGALGVDGVEVRAGLRLAQRAAAVAVHRASASLKDEIVVELCACRARVVDQLEGQLLALVTPHVVISSDHSNPRKQRQQRFFVICKSTHLPAGAAHISLWLPLNS
jgi:hypothetical protein